MTTTVPIPSLVAAAFCARVEEGPDGVDLIGVLGRLTADPHPGTMPGTLESTIPVCLYFVLHAGHVTGTRRVLWVLTNPDGTQKIAFDETWTFEPGSLRAQQCSFAWTVYAPGPHWFHLLVDDEPIGQLCLEVYSTGWHYPASLPA